MAPDPSAALADQEYAVWSTAIAELYLSPASLYAMPGVKLAVIRDTTIVTTESDLPRAPELRWSVRPEVSAIADAQSKSTQPWVLARRFTLPLPYELVSESELQREVRFGVPGESMQAPWTRFYARWPNGSGLIAVSRVGFDHTGSRALVNVTNGSGFQAFHSLLCFLEYDGSRWRVVDRQIARRA